MKLVMVDFDGTLFDTKDVNYQAYNNAMRKYGYYMDYEYYCKFCNGRHYMDFLPQITTSDMAITSEIHKVKQEVYAEYLLYAKCNESLVELLKIIKRECKVALVTTASKKNVVELLDKFCLRELFDFIVTQEDVIMKKPDPEAYLVAMKYFDVTAQDCIIFEDSSIGIEAAERAGVTCYVVRGYN